MAPKLFHLRERHADARTSRTLLLLAKVRDCGRRREMPRWVLNKGPYLDCVVFPTGSRKASWLATGGPERGQHGHAGFQGQGGVDGTTATHSAPGRGPAKGLHHQTGRHPGERGIKGKGPLMSSSFKKLYFSLTTEALSFAKTPSSKKSTLIKLANIRAAEKVEEKSFSSSHVMQVIYTDDVGRPQTAYLQCKCVNELNQWLSALRKVSINNTGLLRSYHPGVFRGDKWSCCHQRDKTDLGCDKTRSRVTLQEWNDPLDHDLEAQLIYRHLLGVEATLREKHQQLRAGPKTGAVPTGPGEALGDPLAQLLQVLQDLREAHRASLAGSPRSEPSRLLELQT